VKFDIEVESEGINEKIFSRVLQPKRNIGDRGWHNFLIPLERYSQKTIGWIFSTSGSGDDLSYCWSAWGWGKIIQISKKNSAEDITHNEGPDMWGENRLTDPSKILPYIRYGNKKAEIQKVELLDKDGFPKLSFKSGEKIIIHYKMFAHQDFVDDLTIGFIIRSKFAEIYGTNTRWQNCDLQGVKKGDMPFVNIYLPLSLGTGTYSLTSAIAIIHPSSEVEVLDRIEDHLIFHIKNDQNMTGIVDLNAKISIK